MCHEEVLEQSTMMAKYPSAARLASAAQQQSWGKAHANTRIYPPSYHLRLGAAAAATANEKQRFGRSSDCCNSPTFQLFAMSTSAFVPRAAKRLRLSSTRAVAPLSCRAFSSSPYLAEQKPGRNNDEKTTHFGFESIAESLKESRGMSYRLSPYVNIQSTDTVPPQSAQFSAPSPPPTTQ